MIYDELAHRATHEAEIVTLGHSAAENKTIAEQRKRARETTLSLQQETSARTVQESASVPSAQTTGAETIPKKK